MNSEAENTHEQYSYGNSICHSDGWYSPRKCNAGIKIAKDFEDCIEYLLHCEDGSSNKNQLIYKEQMEKVRDDLMLFFDATHELEDFQSRGIIGSPHREQLTRIEECFNTQYRTFSDVMFNETSDVMLYMFIHMVEHVMTKYPDHNELKIIYKFVDEMWSAVEIITDYLAKRIMSDRADEMVERIQQDAQLRKYSFRLLAAMCSICEALIFVPETLEADTALYILPLLYRIKLDAEDDYSQISGGVPLSKEEKDEKIASLVAAYHARKDKDCLNELQGILSETAILYEEIDMAASELYPSVLLITEDPDFKEFLSALESRIKNANQFFRIHYVESEDPDYEEFLSALESSKKKANRLRRMKNENRQRREALNDHVDNVFTRQRG